MRLYALQEQVPSSYVFLNDFWGSNSYPETSNLDSRAVQSKEGINIFGFWLGRLLQCDNISYFMLTRGPDNIGKQIFI